MRRDPLKSALLFACGWVPGGAHLYREVTRNLMGTQATHVDKLSRVWPGYVEVWRSRCDLSLEGLEVWIHEGGWTPYPFLINYLLTGKGGVVTNSEGHTLDRYLVHAIDGALTTALPATLIPPERRVFLEALRQTARAEDAMAAVGGTSYTGILPDKIPLAANSSDLCHSGGALEHYRPETLSAFLRECYRVLRPGGVASHVVDHRDHLHHADKRRPFLAHLAASESRYAAFYGHPLLYHNRLLPEQVMLLFEEVGFERIAARRMIYPERRYVEGEEALEGQPGIERTRLTGRFQNASEADLRTAAAHYLYSKPQ
jgi:SAM-dependent methyltransferase